MYENFILQYEYNFRMMKTMQRSVWILKIHCGAILLLQMEQLWEL